MTNNADATSPAKGNMLKTAIIGSLAASTLYELFNAGYSLIAHSKDGTSVSLHPSVSDSSDHDQLEGDHDHCNPEK